MAPPPSSFVSSPSIRSQSMSESVSGRISPSGSDEVGEQPDLSSKPLVSTTSTCSFCRVSGRANGRCSLCLASLLHTIDCPLKPSKPLPHSFPRFPPLDPPKRKRAPRRTSPEPGGKTLSPCPNHSFILIKNPLEEQTWLSHLCSDCYSSSPFVPPPTVKLAACAFQCTLPALLYECMPNPITLHPIKPPFSCFFFLFSLLFFFFFSSSWGEYAWGC